MNIESVIIFFMEEVLTTNEQTRFENFTTVGKLKTYRVCIKMLNCAKEFWRRSLENQNNIEHNRVLR